MKVAAAVSAAWLALAVLACGAPAARADTHSSSYSIWSVSGSRVMARFLVPVNEARSLTGTDLPVLTSGKLGDYLLQHIAVSAAGRDCPAVDQGFDLGRVNPLNAGADLYGYEIMFRCENARGMLLKNTALFGHLPGHVNFARVQFDNQYSEQLFTASRETLAVPDSGSMPAAGMGQYLRLGASHILRSPDRWCFLLGSLLLLRRRQQVLSVVSGLGLGYLLSALLAGAGWMVPRMAMIEAFVGFLVLVPAVRILAPKLSLAHAAVAGGLAVLAALGTLYLRGSAPALVFAGAALLLASLLAVPARLTSRVAFSLLLATIFGFLDGFVLPAELVPLQLPARKLIPIVLGFDVGAVLVDALLITGVLALVLALRIRLRTLSRPFLNDIASASLGGLGAFWLLSRLYS